MTFALPNQYFDSPTASIPITYADNTPLLNGLANPYCNSLVPPTDFSQSRLYLTILPPTNDTCVGDSLLGYSRDSFW